MTHRVRQCLIQLCGLHGAIFENEAATVHHISGVMNGLLTLINKYVFFSACTAIDTDAEENQA